MTKEEAAVIAEQLNHTIQPARYEEAARLIESILAELDD